MENSNPLEMLKEQKKQQERERVLRNAQRNGLKLVSNEPIVLYREIFSKLDSKGFYKADFDSFLMVRYSYDGTIDSYTLFWGDLLENKSGTATLPILQSIEPKRLTLSNGDEVVVNTRFSVDGEAYYGGLEKYEYDGIDEKTGKKIRKTGERLKKHIAKDYYYFMFPGTSTTSQNQNRVSPNYKSEQFDEKFTLSQDDTKPTRTNHEEKKKSGFSKTDKIIAFCIIGFFLALVIWAGWSKSRKESLQERTYQTESVIETSENADKIAEQITKQLDQLTETINALPEPNENNVSRCGDKVKVLQWEVIDIPEDNPNAERLKKSQRRAVETFVNAKNRYIKKLEKYDEYAGVYYDEVEGYLLDEE